MSEVFLRQNFISEIHVLTILYLNSARNPVTHFPHQKIGTSYVVCLGSSVHWFMYFCINIDQSARQNIFRIHGYGPLVIKLILFYSFWQDLTYKIKSFTSDIRDTEKQRQTFRKAFKLWSDATNLRINENRYADDKDVDIHISFETGYHSDAYPFDGAGGTLAHAFYPHNNLGKWTNKQNTNLVFPV